MELVNRQLTDEIKQSQAITECLINKILYSKRLLVDHVEALEQCMAHMPAMGPIKSKNPNEVDRQGMLPKITTDGEIFTARNTCVLLAGTILEHFITPKSLRLTLIPSLLFSSGFGIVYFVKNMFVFRNKIVERELDSLIRVIDEFGNCIRRNMTYFNEIIIMKQQELIETRQIERAWDCITAAKEVTEILYDATRKLESQYPLPAKFAQHYAAMEELRECEYFKNNVTDYNPKHIKDFHNIFAYVQSQFLLRLALTISTKPSISKLNLELGKIDSLVRQLVLEEENHFKNLSIELNKKNQTDLSSLNTSRTMQNRSGPVAVLQDSSLKLSARMVAVAGQCHALDITLQRLTEAESEKRNNAKQLLEVANNMHSIENALSVCFDDFQRLILVYNKFLNSKLDKPDTLSEKSDNKLEDSDESDIPESFLRVEISRNANDADKKDDFYAYMFDEKQQTAEQEQLELESTVGEMEILNFDKRITKGKFRPVLKQLKDRIDPIRQVMLQKEREVLASKGINVDELFGSEEEQQKHQQADNSKADVTNNATDSDSEGSADVEFQKRSKKLKEQDNFAEMRNFLAQKQAINLFQADVPVSAVRATGDEEILESEC